MDDFTILNAPASQAAPRLLGCELHTRYAGNDIRVRIVETEAYDQSDVASHSYKGETQRTKVMFGPAGHLYVYFTYGMHYCGNIVVGDRGHGAGVLLRAVEPLDGAEKVLAWRRNKSGVQITNGPAKLCQALGIDMKLSGHDLRKAPLQLVVQPPLPAGQIVTTTRVGITYGKDVPWRFYIKDNPYVSVKG